MVVDINVISSTGKGGRQVLMGDDGEWVSDTKVPLLYGELQISGDLNNSMAMVIGTSRECCAFTCEIQLMSEYTKTYERIAFMSIHTGVKCLDDEDMDYTIVPFFLRDLKGTYANVRIILQAEGSVGQIVVRTIQFQDTDAIEGLSGAALSVVKSTRISPLKDIRDSYMQSMGIIQNPSHDSERRQPLDIPTYNNISQQAPNLNNNMEGHFSGNTIPINMRNDISNGNGVNFSGVPNSGNTGGMFNNLGARPQGISPINEEENLSLSTLVKDNSNPFARNRDINSSNLTTDYSNNQVMQLPDNNSNNNYRNNSNGTSKDMGPSRDTMLPRDYAPLRSNFSPKRNESIGNNDNISFNNPNTLTNTNNRKANNSNPNDNVNGINHNLNNIDDKYNNNNRDYYAYNRTPVMLPPMGNNDIQRDVLNVPQNRPYNRNEMAPQNNRDLILRRNIGYEDKDDVYVSRDISEIINSNAPKIDQQVLLQRKAHQLSQPNVEALKDDSINNISNNINIDNNTNKNNNNNDINDINDTNENENENENGDGDNNNSNNANTNNNENNDDDNNSEENEGYTEVYAKSIKTLPNEGPNYYDQCPTSKTDIQINSNFINETRPKLLDHNPINITGSTASPLTDPSSESNLSFEDDDNMDNDQGKNTNSDKNRSTPLPIKRDESQYTIKKSDTGKTHSRTSSSKAKAPKAESSGDVSTNAINISKRQVVDLRSIPYAVVNNNDNDNNNENNISSRSNSNTHSRRRSESRHKRGSNVNMSPSFEVGNISNSSGIERSIRRSDNNNAKRGKMGNRVGRVQKNSSPPSISSSEDSDNNHNDIPSANFSSSSNSVSRNRRHERSGSRSDKYRNKRQSYSQKELKPENSPVISPLDQDSESISKSGQSVPSFVNKVASVGYFTVHTNQEVSTSTHESVYNATGSSEATIDELRRIPIKNARDDKSGITEFSSPMIKDRAKEIYLRKDISGVNNVDEEGVREFTTRKVGSNSIININFNAQPNNSSFNDSSDIFGDKVMSPLLMSAAESITRSLATTSTIPTRNEETKSRRHPPPAQPQLQTQQTQQKKENMRSSGHRSHRHQESNKSEDEFAPQQLVRKVSSKGEIIAEKKKNISKKNLDDVVPISGPVIKKEDSSKSVTQNEEHSTSVNPKNKDNIYLTNIPTTIDKTRNNNNNKAVNKTQKERMEDEEEEEEELHMNDLDLRSHAAVMINTPSSMPNNREQQFSDRLHVHKPSESIDIGLTLSSALVNKTEGNPHSMSNLTIHENPADITGADLISPINITEEDQEKSIHPKSMARTFQDTHFLSALNETEVIKMRSNFPYIVRTSKLLSRVFNAVANTRFTVKILIRNKFNYGNIENMTIALKVNKELITLIDGREGSPVTDTDCGYSISIKGSNGQSDVHFRLKPNTFEKVEYGHANVKRADKLIQERYSLNKDVIYIVFVPGTKINGEEVRSIVLEFKNEGRARVFAALFKCLKYSIDQEFVNKSPYGDMCWRYLKYCYQKH